ncbi:type II toxin-antitoxin system RelE/ParE family toxin [Hymenobacter latericus]|uniref:type II toxin-antitoxin system RelE/ParE family toxin n=1 Tax=Hymenobacter sp. YIM 151858-1 TaxID=2987688 RepID=UPI002225E108|nr:type II toxin-antitoxin system RelE/ParE family toxin [Hymenobacter sp. YIM 151858-1]UYZ61193.1 type II toxin-antitoxin system RelE/ParE family toxin [Hymenobacter sp. YIM 151858-1]
MQKKINVKMTPEAREFMKALPSETRRELGVTIRRVQNGEKGSFFKKLTDSDGIWEFKEEDANNAYRLFAFWDSTGVEETLIVCTHGIDKKSPKTPKKEIQKAERIKRDHFGSDS